MHITELETPCLILDERKLENNIQRMNKRLDKNHIKLRPHGKTAKNMDIIKRCLISPAAGITASTLKEAEYYFHHGIKDIIYAVGIAPVKLKRVCNLIKSGCRLTVILDSVAQAETVAAKAAGQKITIPVCIEIDSDGQRSGVRPNDPLLLEIARLLERREGTELKGVLTHAGVSYKAKNIDEIKKTAAEERAAAVDCAELLGKHNLPCPIISIGSTPTVLFGEDFSGITEVRAGVYMFMDLVMAGLGVCKQEDIAISVLASVIGHQKTKERVIIDAGWIALSGDRGTATQKTDMGYGQVCNREGTPIPPYIVSAVSQEHGIVSRHDSLPVNWEDFTIGDMIRILPNHACAMAAMHDCYHITGNGTEISHIWPRINRW